MSTYFTRELPKVRAHFVKLIFLTEVDIQRLTPYVLMSETYTYSLDFIKNNEGYIKKIIKMLFTSTVRAEHCGKNYTKLYFIDKEGNILDTFTFMQGLISLVPFITGVTFCRKSNITEKIYEPMYKSPAP